MRANLTKVWAPDLLLLSILTRSWGFIVLRRQPWVHFQRHDFQVDGGAGSEGPRHRWKDASACKRSSCVANVRLEWRLCHRRVTGTRVSGESQWQCVGERERDGLPWTSDLWPLVSELRRSQTKDGRAREPGRSQKKEVGRRGGGLEGLLDAARGLLGLYLIQPRSRITVSISDTNAVLMRSW